METLRKKRLTRFSFILNGMLFLLGGYGFIAEGVYLFGGIQVLGGVLNLLKVKSGPLFGSKSSYLEDGINLFNIIIPITIGFNYQNQGTQYLHLVWFLVAIMNIVVFFIFIKKRQSKSVTTD